MWLAMDLIISLDSEDYLTPEAADAELWWATELTARGLRGSFQVVSELIRSLERRGRSDVIEAMAAHEIGFHTNYHSWPPTHPEALEGKSLSEGIDWVMRREGEGLGKLQATFGRMPISYCSPGDSWTPATLLAMASAGIKIFCDAHFTRAAGHPFWFCGLLLTHYSIGVDSFISDPESMEQRFKQKFEGIARETGPDGLMVVYTHPCRLVTAAFWDDAFANGTHRPIEDSPPAPLWPAVHAEQIKDGTRRLLDWIQGLPDIRFLDFSTLYSEVSPTRRDLQVLLDECGLTPDQVDALPLREDKDAHFPSKYFDELAYIWPPYPEGFTGKALFEQAGQLAWTSAPASR